MVWSPSLYVCHRRSERVFSLTCHLCASYLTKSIANASTSICKSKAMKEVRNGLLGHSGIHWGFVRPSIRQQFLSWTVCDGLGFAFCWGLNKTCYCGLACICTSCLVLWGCGVQKVVHQVERKKRSQVSLEVHQVQLSKHAHERDQGEDNDLSSTSCLEIFKHPCHSHNFDINAVYIKKTTKQKIPQKTQRHSKTGKRNACIAHSDMWRQEEPQKP